MSALTHLFCSPPVEASVVEKAPGFSLGRVPQLHMKRRCRLAAKKAKLKAKPKASHKPKAKPKKQGLPYDECVSSTEIATILNSLVDYTFNTFNFRSNSWLLDDREVPIAVRKFLRTAGNTYTEIFKTIVAKKRKQEAYFANYKCYMPDEPTVPLLNSYLKIALKNQALRVAFSSLARLFIKSRLSVKNTEDLVTGETPVSPVSLVDWKTRSIYTFEASTILRDMVSRLTMSHCQFFPNPKKPRNPYTNELLSEGQFYSVVQQMRKYGQTHWTLEALYSTKYNKEEFDNDMYTKLKRSIHNSVFANPTSDVAKEVLIDYIEEEHQHHLKDYERDVYEWAIETIPHHYRMHEWRVQCAKYYKITHFPGNKEDDDREKERIDTATKRLCAMPLALMKHYETAKKIFYIPIADRVSVVNIQISTEDLTAVLSAYAEDSSDED